MDKEVMRDSGRFYQIHLVKIELKEEKDKVEPEY